MKRKLLGLSVFLALTASADTMAVVCQNIGAPTEIGGATDNGDGGALACGDDAQANGANSTALGVQSRGTGDASVAVGPSASAAGTFNVAIGTNASTSGNSSAALGTSTSANAQAVAIGNGAAAGGIEAVALGNMAFGSGLASTVVGSMASVTGQEGVAVGTLSEAGGQASVAIGSASEVSEDLSVAIGPGANVATDQSVALGLNAVVTASEANSEGSTAVGARASAAGRFSSAFGYLAEADLAGVAVGFGTKANFSGTVAVGLGANTVGDGGTAVGWLSESSQRGVAAGFSSKSFTNAVALGRDSIAAAGAVSLGAYSQAPGGGSAALGFRAFAPQPSTVVIGQIPGVNGGFTYNRVGMGTEAPLAALHVARDDGEAQVLVEELAPTAAPRTLFKLSNPGNTKFELENSDAGERWAFTNSGSDFRISRQGSGVVELRIDNNGDAFLAGSLFELSDREAKTGIAPVDASAILAKVADLPIAQWAYRHTPETLHIGPMAQDFHAAFGLGPNDTSVATLDVGGVALASVQALNERNDALQAELESLRKDKRDMEQRIVLLEKAIQGLLPQAAHVGNRAKR